jgi:hypothetical protein
MRHILTSAAIAALLVTPAAAQTARTAAPAPAVTASQPAQNTNPIGGIGVVIKKGGSAERTAAPGQCNHAINSKGTGATNRTAGSNGAAQGCTASKGGYVTQASHSNIANN